MANADLGKARSASETFIEGLTCCGALSIFVTLGILWTLGSETISFFETVSPTAFFFDATWSPFVGEFLNAPDPQYGIRPLILGTFLISGIALLVAVPIGLGAAIYLSEYAQPKTRHVLKPALEILAGIPTIVFGFFALIILTPLIQTILPNLANYNALSAGIVMGFMIVPMVCSLSEDALFSVPQTLREAGYGLGASKVSTICRVVIPTASSGIAVSILLAFGRAIGETMIVWIAAAPFAPERVTVSWNPLDSMESMTAFIARTSSGDISPERYTTLCAVAATLFFLTFMINWLSQRLIVRIGRTR